MTSTILAIIEIGESVEEILIIDQTPVHDSETSDLLHDLNSRRKIRWLKRERPSITKAMNFALTVARTDLVLFLDDDISVYPNLVNAHRESHMEYPDIWASVGQVVQPWQQPVAIHPPGRLSGLRRDFDFPFHSTISGYVSNVMAGNLCVNRQLAQQIGGFDENYIGSAYRFETDFARRINEAGGRIRFCPEARIDHLRVNEGGTRTYGSHLTSAAPKHGIGDHYYALVHGAPLERWQYCVSRIFREVSTRFHLFHPWWIPVKLVGEIRAMWGGWKLARAKRRETRRERREKE